MKRNLITALLYTVITTLIFGIGYPFLVTAAAQLLFHDKANGQLIQKDGQLVGSRIIGQPFSAPNYFHSRPSAAGNGYDAANSSGSNYAPTNKKLIDRVAADITTAQTDQPGIDVPIDLVTASASGLDPHITPAAAEFQVARIAHERSLNEAAVRQLVAKHTQGRQLGFLGESRVNVLELNLDLDHTVPSKQRKAGYPMSCFWDMGSCICPKIIPMGLFKKKIKQEHKVMLQAERAAGALQPEYHRPTPECPHPKRWHMYDSMTAEAEVLEFLRTLVTTIKPELVVETGSFLGVSTLWIAEGLKTNGFGKIISCEFDPVVFAAARKKIAASGLAEWIELRNESSLEMNIDGTIDLFFSDSDMPIREGEVKRFLPQISPYGLILLHDASSHLKIVRDAAHAMEAEGLLSCVFLPTPRGLVVAQKREGRC